MIDAVSRIARSLRFQPLAQLTTFTVLVASFVVITGAILLEQNFTSFLTHWGREVKVDVYLQDGVTGDATAALKKTIESSGLFSKIIYFSKDQAADQFKKRLGQYLPGILDDLGADNPLPASFELKAQHGIVSQRDYERMIHFVKSLKKQTGVDDISYGQGWVENYASALHIFSLSIGVFIFVLLAGCIFVIGNATGNAIAQRRDEIEIMELFGATKDMVVGPFIFEGLIMGLAASVTALALAYVFYKYQLDLFSRSLSFWNFQTAVKFLSLSHIVLIVMIGTGLGGASAFLWARKIATGWAAAEAK